MRLLEVGITRAGAAIRGGLGVGGVRTAARIGIGDIRSAGGIVRASILDGRVGRDAAVVLHQRDLIRQEVVDALAVDELERGSETRHKTLDELGSGLLLGLSRTGGDETDGEVAEAQELDLITLLEVLLDVVGVAVEHVLHVARSGRRLGGNLVSDIVGGECTVVDG